MSGGAPEYYAFIGGSLSSARTDIFQRFAVVDFRGERFGKFREDGRLVRFIIITNLDHLRGTRLTGYEFLPCARVLSNRIWSELDEMARARCCVAESRGAATRDAYFNRGGV